MAVQDIFLLSGKGQFRYGPFHVTQCVQQKVSRGKSPSNVAMSMLCCAPSLKVVASLVDSREKMCEDVFASGQMSATVLRAVGQTHLCQISRDSHIWQRDRVSSWRAGAS